MTRRLIRLLAIAPGLAVVAVALGDASPAPTPPAARVCAVLPRPSLRIRLVLEPGVPEELRPVVESTVATVWRSEGLTIAWLPEAPPGHVDRTTAFWLRIVTGPLGDLARQAEPTLGMVRFMGDVPRPDVLVSLAAVREWARRERDRHFRVIFHGMTRLDGLEFAGYDELARRGLGYAAAHEVGHFVLGLKSHDRAGLMRRALAACTVADVEHPDHRLSPESRERLRRRLAQGAACPIPGAVPFTPEEVCDECS
ncbi:MAG: hypothetical protein R2745_16875 [Vicinamibacterales bacterium]